MRRCAEEDFIKLNLASLDISDSPLDKLKAAVLANNRLPFEIKQRVIRVQSIEELLAALRGKSG